jgi:hypothetical protein
VSEDDDCACDPYDDIDVDVRIDIIPTARYRHDDTTEEQVHYPMHSIRFRLPYNILSLADVEKIYKLELQYRGQQVWGSFVNKIGEAQ